MSEHVRRSTTRPPVGAGRLLLRRTGALAVVLVVGWSAVQAITSYFGDDDGSVTVGAPAGVDPTIGGLDDAAAAQATVDTADAVDDAAVSAVEGVAGGGVAEGAGGEPLVESVVASGDADADASGAAVDGASDDVPSPSNKVKVYIVGDSDAGTFGPYLQQLLDGTNLVESELNYKVSSGLARPDFYDWPVELAAALPAADPDIVVATFGGNDAQGLSLPGDTLEFIVGDPVANEAEWSEEYQRRAGEVMDLLLENDRVLIWVGIPNDDNPDVTARLAIQDRAVRAAAAERPEVVFVDAWKRFSGRDGGWAEFVIDPRDGIGKDVRAADGFHLNQNGAEILALDIAQAVRDELRARGAAI